jgi:hypothetical protein
MKIKLITGILILSVALNIFFFISKNRAVRPIANEGLIQTLKVKEANSTLLQETCQTFMLEQFRNEELSFPKQLHLSGGETIDTKKLLPESGSVLVFRFDRNACSSCIENELTNIAALRDSADMSGVVILTSSFNNASQAKMYMERFNVVYKVYNVLDTDLGFTTENAVQPCYFLLDKELKSNLFFMPDKNNPSLSNNYLQLVKARFLNH